tara:strand:- start:118 stop:279 length:162 start_codon:yes stop_codon:yes gene_type:complete
MNFKQEIEVTPEVTPIKIESSIFIYKQLVRIKVQIPPAHQIKKACQSAGFFYL